MWVHLATTFMAGDTMKSYINGVLIGSLQVPANQIGVADSSLIIGAMAWGAHNGYNIYGDIDEIRIWSYAKTREQLNAEMFKQMKGDEQNLVGYWNCNETAGDTMHDRTMYHNHGKIFPLVADTFYAWHASYAVLGNERMYDQQDVSGIWYGKEQLANPYSLSQTGLNLITDIGTEKVDYIVYGNNADTGTTVSDLEAGAPANFKRAGRVWYVNVGGNVHADMVFNLVNTAGSGSQLSTSLPTANYTLLVRDDSTGNFAPFIGADYKAGVGVKFSGVSLQNKYFTIGAGDAPWAGINETANKLSDIRIYPNPVNSVLSIDNIALDELLVKVLDMMGNMVFTGSSASGNLSIDMSGHTDGIYIVQIMNKENMLTKKIVLQTK
jgi:hypothetical protein